MFQKLTNTIEWLIEKIIAILCIVLLSVLFLKVVGRYGFGGSFFGTEFIIQFCFVWMCLLGIGLAVRRREHFEVDVLANGLPARLHRIHNFLINLLILIGGGLITWLSYPFAMDGVFETEPSTDISMIYLFFSMVIGGILIVWMAIDLLIYQNQKTSEKLLLEDD